MQCFAPRHPCRTKSFRYFDKNKNFLFEVFPLEKLHFKFVPLTLDPPAAGRVREPAFPENIFLELMFRKLMFRERRRLEGLRLKLKALQNSIVPP
jgi:hypothetical protein